MINQPEATCALEQLLSLSIWRFSLMLRPLWKRCQLTCVHTSDTERACGSLQLSQPSDYTAFSRPLQKLSVFFIKVCSLTIYKFLKESLQTAMTYDFKVLFHQQKCDRKEQHSLNHFIPKCYKSKFLLSAKYFTNY